MTSTKQIKTTKRGRKPGSFEKRDYFRRYHSNLHALLESPVILYQLSRVLKTQSALTASKNAFQHGSMPVKKTFNTIAEALWIIDRGKSGMKLEEYLLWLADEAPKE